MTTLPLRLHLGCGQNYLDGYTNIDFPLDNHSVQRKSVADRHADITSLSFQPDTVTEIRLHHVFEHFPRPVITAMVATWSQWLTQDGRLHIEVPDLQRCAWSLINPFVTANRKMVVERHLFGSHEASWAIHYEAYSPASLKTMLVYFGFKPHRLRRNSWRGTHNFELICLKKNAPHGMVALREAAQKYLANFMVDNTEGERAMLDTWMQAYDKQMSKGTAS